MSDFGFWGVHTLIPKSWRFQALGLAHGQTLRWQNGPRPFALGYWASLLSEWCDFGQGQCKMQWRPVCFSRTYCLVPCYCCCSCCCCCCCWLLCCLLVVVLVLFLMLLLLLVESFRSSPPSYTVGFPFKQDIIRFSGPLPGMALRSLHASVLYIALCCFTGLHRLFFMFFFKTLRGSNSFEVNQKGAYSGRQEGSGPRCPAQRHPRMDIKCWVKP